MGVLIGTPFRTRRCIAWPRTRSGRRSSSTWATSVSCGVQAGPAPTSPTKGWIRNPVTNVPTGGKRAHQLHAPALEADLLVGLAQRGLPQVLVGPVLAPTGEGDLTGMPAHVGAALGEHGHEPGLVREQRHEHGRRGRPVRVEPGGLLRR